MFLVLIVVTVLRNEVNLGHDLHGEVTRRPIETTDMCIKIGFCPHNWLTQARGFP